MIPDKSRFFYLATIWGAALLLALVTYQQPGTHLWPGLDQAWAYGLNYAFDKGLVMGRDIHFTFGPLGWLEHTRVVSLNMLYVSTVFSLLLSVAMNVAVLHLAWQVSSQKYLRVVNLLAAVALVIYSFPEMQRLLILGYALIFLHWLTLRNSYLLLLSCTVTFCVLIKFSYGAAAFSMWFLYLALLYYRDRNIKTVHVALLSLVASYIVVWLIMYGSLSGAMGYLEGEIHISSGNASAMALNPANNWWAIGIFYLSIFLSAIIIQCFCAHRFSLLALVFAGPIFVWTKYTFSQEQALHFVPILAFVVYLIAIFFIVTPGLVQKISLSILLLCACLSWKAMHTESVGTPDYYNVPHSTLSMPNKGLLKNPSRHIKYMFNVWRRGETERLEPLRLPLAMRTMIGEASVDIYPWELTIAAANNLNWHPRPAFQIYIAYTPWLDRKNSEFFSNAKAPEYIVWHHHEFQDVMNRYALSSEPMTTESILRHYSRVSCEGIFCLWKHTNEDQLKPRVDIKMETVKWNEWISTPQHTGDILRAKLSAKRTLLGHLNLLAWKEGGIEIDYKLENGVIKTHDLLIDNAASGVWIAPYFEKYLGDTTAIRVEEIPSSLQNNILAQPAAQGYMDKVETTATGGGHFVGWASIPSVDSRLQQQYILLTGTQKSYLVYADKFNRSDVVDYFKTLGQSHTGQCGFYQDVAAGQIPDGEYQVRFVVRVDDKWAAVPDQGLVLRTDASLNKTRVTEVRFRTTRPWVFRDEMVMQWQELSLKFRDDL